MRICAHPSPPSKSIRNFWRMTPFFPYHNPIPKRSKILGEFSLKKRKKVTLEFWRNAKVSGQLGEKILALQHRVPKAPIFILSALFFTFGAKLSEIPTSVSNFLKSLLRHSFVRNAYFGAQLPKILNFAPIVRKSLVQHRKFQKFKISD